jgi:hypothetical protein
VRPAAALAGASRVGAGDATPLGPVPLVPDAPLYLDAPWRVATKRVPPLFANAPDEPPVPEALLGAALVPLPDGDRALDSDEHLKIELSRPADVWVAWPPDETRNFARARRWLKVAERLSEGRMLMVSRLRVHCLAELGQWDRAYREFRELMSSRPKRDYSVPNAFQNFLLQTVYESYVRRDQSGIQKWHGRLRAEFPGWTMTPAETAEFVARTLGVSLPRENREE